MNYVNKLLICICFTTVFSSQVWSEKITFGASDYPPYFSDRLPKGGVLVEITRRIMELKGYEVNVVFKPFARTYEEAKYGQVEGLIVLWHTQERERWFSFTDPLPPNQLGFYVQKDRKIQYQTYKDLEKYRIGIVRGYANPKGFDKANLNTFEVPEDERLLLMLKYRRIDLALMDRGVGQHLMDKQFPELKNKVRFITPALEEKPQYVVFSRSNAKHEQYVRDFNEGLKQLKASGEFDKIIKNSVME